jgi:hypothetical protein
MGVPLLLVAIVSGIAVVRLRRMRAAEVVEPT